MNMMNRSGLTICSWKRTQFKNELIYARDLVTLLLCYEKQPCLTYSPISSQIKASHKKKGYFTVWLTLGRLSKTF